MLQGDFRQFNLVSLSVVVLGFVLLKYCLFLKQTPPTSSVCTPTCCRKISAANWSTQNEFLTLKVMRLRVACWRSSSTWPRNATSWWRRMRWSPRRSWRATPPSNPRNSWVRSLTPRCSSATCRWVDCEGGGGTSIIAQLIPESWPQGFVLSRHTPILYFPSFQAWDFSAINLKFGFC